MLGPLVIDSRLEADAGGWWRLLAESFAVAVVSIGTHVQEQVPRQKEPGESLIDVSNLT